jgi:hypothetical protein
MFNDDIDPKVLTQRFIEALDTKDADEMCKKASAAASEFTRRKLREDAFSPAIIPHEEVTNSDLDRFVNSEHPMMICEMEADQPPAKTVSFNDTGDTTPYFANKYLLVFYTNVTPVWTKNVNLLRTYRADIRELITDNSLRDLSRRKDIKFMSEVDQICGLVPGAPSPLTDMEQNVLYPGRLDRDNWVSTKQLLPDRSLLNGVFLCNHRTFSEFSRWKRNEMGGDFSQTIIREGVGKAFESAKFGDIDFIVTLKSDIVPHGVIYEFTKPNYLGRAGVLQKPTMYVKKDKDILSFSCREILGVTIANTAGVQKVTYQDIANNYGGDGRIVVSQ